MKSAQLLRKKRVLGFLLVSAALGTGNVVVAADMGGSTTGSPSGSDSSTTPSAGPGTSSGMSGSSGTGSSTSPYSGSDPTSSPPAGYVGKPVPPSTAEQPDSAFKKLALEKGYVAKEDIKELQGFETIFDSSDANGDGRLSADEFRKAWRAYVASDKANRG